MKISLLALLMLLINVGQDKPVEESHLIDGLDVRARVSRNNTSQEIQWFKSCKPTDKTIISLEKMNDLGIVYNEEFEAEYESGIIETHVQPCNLNLLKNLVLGATPEDIDYIKYLDYAKDAIDEISCHEDARCDLNHEYDNGLTLLEMAANNGDREKVILLLERNDNINNANYENAIELALRNGHYDLVDEMIALKN